MGKPTGFIEYLRQLPKDRSALERINDWKEFHLHMSDEELRKQGARCMDCGIPFCHTGQLVSGMASGCPIHNLIPEWNDLVYRGLWKEALDRLHKTNNFPDFTGRVCPAPCEGSCVLGINKPPVTIKNIEYAIAERGWDEGWITPEPPKKRTGKKVAVVGSGPAGLCAAAQLNKAGHLVTVFERADRPGGLLMYGIPNMKLDKNEVVLRRIKQMEDEGIQFTCNTEVGKNLPAEQLLKDFDAVVLCTGATKPRDLPIEGRALKGIHFAMDFLKQQNKRVSHKEVKEEDIFATGKNVVVIGGGDTGSDCVGTSNRQGAKSVTQFELMPKPPGERTPFMPWPTYPMILKTSSSHDEGCDRHWAIATKEFIGDGKGNLKALKIVDLEWKFADDLRPSRFEEVPGSEREIPCELTLLAMGFIHPQHTGLLDELEVEYDERGNVKASEKAYQTNIPKIFTAGDMRRGQSLVVWAISEGRECARQVDEHLMGVSLLETKDDIPQHV